MGRLGLCGTNAIKLNEIKHHLQTNIIEVDDMVDCETDIDKMVDSESYEMFNIV